MSAIDFLTSKIGYSIVLIFEFLIPLGLSLPFNFDRFRYLLRTTMAKAIVF